MDDESLDEQIPLETGPDRDTPSRLPDLSKCPYCGADHAPEQGRFCDSCGMSVIPYVGSKGRGSEDEEQPEPVREDAPTVRCRACGTKSAGAICPACGNKLPTPE